MFVFYCLGTLGFNHQPLWNLLCCLQPIHDYVTKMWLPIFPYYNDVPNLQIFKQDHFVIVNLLDEKTYPVYPKNRQLHNITTTKLEMKAFSTWCIQINFTYKLL